jgi:hypothetical protein
MALPQFVKTGLTTITWTRSYILPYQRPLKPRQRVGRTDGGQFYVATLGSADQEFILQFEQMPATDWALATAWLNSTTINWAANTFTFIDTAGTSYTVRCLDFEDEQVGDDNYRFRFHLVKEVA